MPQERPVMINPSVDFISRHQMKRMLKHNSPDLEGAAIISINDSASEIREMTRLLEGRCFHISCFADKDQINFSHEEILEKLPVALSDMADYTAIKRKSYQQINLHEALGILKFVSENKEKPFFVHCFMGISRSAAVAKYIDVTLDRRSPTLEKYDSYNSAIYRLLRAADKALSQIN